jgi:hypothetical protein
MQMKFFAWFINKKRKRANVINWDGVCLMKQKMIFILFIYLFIYLFFKIFLVVDLFHAGWANGVFRYLLTTLTRDI